MNERADRVPRILVVEDEHHLAEGIAEMLARFTGLTPAVYPPPES